jgi:hypothetical protein
MVIHPKSTDFSFKFIYSFEKQIVVNNQTTRKKKAHANQVKAKRLIQLRSISIGVQSMPRKCLLHCDRFQD